jgi:DNA topoisomerase I
MLAYHAEHLEEVEVAEQGDLTEGEKALLDLLNKKLRRDLRKAA